MRVKCLAQEHNAVPWPGLQPEPPDLESSALIIRPSPLPHTVQYMVIIQINQSASMLYLFSTCIPTLNERLLLLFIMLPC